MRIAFSQINVCLGNIEANTKKILAEIHRASERSAKLIVFPEFSLLGYVPEDMLELDSYISACEKALRQITKKMPANIYAFVGLPTRSKNKRLHNSVAVITKNKVHKLCHKTLFPNYDVFDEARYFEPGDPKKNIVRIGNKKILITVCEDLWLFHPRYKERYPNIYKSIDKKSIDYVINMSGSPFNKEKLDSRKKMLASAYQYFKKPILYVNLVGGQDALIFDGKSMAINKSGKIISQSLGFQEDLNLVDFEKAEAGKRHHSQDESLYEDMRSALVLGIRDFIQKNSFSKVHIGLSGGVDSALVASLAVDAVGPANVHCIAMPTQFNASESLSLAKKLCENLNCSLQTINIDTHYKNLSKDLEQAFQITKFSVMHENLQSRIRGQILMAYSNLNHSMLLATGNKSEFAVGYSTLYGDMCGGLAPIGDLLKKEVFGLAKHYNKNYEIIPEQIIARPPSAELRPNQKDEDTLPPYSVLDKMVEDVVCKNKIPTGKYAKWFLDKFYQSEFKRRQAPPILKISYRAFGRGRRYPITLARL